jgi:flagellar basal body-associated protein FliL
MLKNTDKCTLIKIIGVLLVLCAVLMIITYVGMGKHGIKGVATYFISCRAIINEYICKYDINLSNGRSCVLLVLGWNPLVIDSIVYIDSSTIDNVNCSLYKDGDKKETSYVIMILYCVMMIGIIGIIYLLLNSKKKEKYPIVPVYADNYNIM